LPDSLDTWTIAENAVRITYPLYQYIVLRWVHPVEALMVAVVLALVPYLLLRGPINRSSRRESRS
jgi:hypothetical protein